MCNLKNKYGQSTPEDKTFRLQCLPAFLSKAVLKCNKSATKEDTATRLNASSLGGGGERLEDKKRNKMHLQSFHSNV